MDLRQLGYFVAIAEEGQFTRAAQRVLVAQPAISAQIRRLERELGETLFHREPRAARLTAAGEALLPHARAALAAAERARESIASLRGLLRGRLRVGVAGPIDQRLAQALGDFRRAHPAVEILLTEQHNEPLLASLANGEVDAGVIGLGVQPLPPQVRARIIAVQPLVLAVRTGDPLSKRKTTDLASLRSEPMITLVRGSGLRSVLESACSESGFSPRITAETGDLTSLLDLVAEGLGIAVVPRSATDRPGLAVVRITRPRLQRRTALAWNETGASPAGRAFLSLADRHFAPPTSRSEARS